MKDFETLPVCFGKRGEGSQGGSGWRGAVWANGRSDPRGGLLTSVPDRGGRGAATGQPGVQRVVSCMRVGHQGGTPSGVSTEGTLPAGQRPAEIGRGPNGEGWLVQAIRVGGAGLSESIAGAASIRVDGAGYPSRRHGISELMAQAVRVEGAGRPS